jgi:hypothetical protein
MTDIRIDVLDLFPGAVSARDIVLPRVRGLSGLIEHRHALERMLAFVDRAKTLGADDPLREAAFVACLTAYAGCFVGSQRGQLDPKRYFADDPELLVQHEEAMHVRDQHVVHLAFRRAQVLAILDASDDIVGTYEWHVVPVLWDDAVFDRLVQLADHVVGQLNHKIATAHEALLAEIKAIPPVERAAVLRPASFMVVSSQPPDRRRVR